MSAGAAVGAAEGALTAFLAEGLVGPLAGGAVFSPGVQLCAAARRLRVGASSAAIVSRLCGEGL